MLKTAGAFLILLASTGIGVSFSMDLKKRCEELRILKRMAAMLRGEIRYAKTPLPEAFVRIAQRLPEPFRGFLEEVAGELEQADGTGLGEIWNRKICQCLGQTRLTGADRERLKTLGEVLGYLDREMQLAAIDLYLEQLDGGIAEALEDRGSKERLYRSLGVAGGIFLVILLI